MFPSVANDNSIIECLNICETAFFFSGFIDIHIPVPHSTRTALAQTTRGKGSSLSTRRPTTASLAFCAHPQLALSGVHNNMPSYIIMTGFNDEAWTQESRPHPAMRAVFLSLGT